LRTLPGTENHCHAEDLPANAAAERSPWVYWTLLSISLAFIVIGIGILLFSEIPRFDQFLWAAGLGLAAALLASDNYKP